MLYSKPIISNIIIYVLMILIKNFEFTLGRIPLIDSIKIGGHNYMGLSLVSASLMFVH